MADLEKTYEEPIEQFFELTDEVAAGMLGVEGSGQHMQPMHPHIDRKSRTIWFYAKKDSDIARAVENGNKAHFCVVGKDHDYHACVSGDIRVNHNDEMIERYWDTITAAWFNAKDDPNLTMLEFQLDNGVAWASTSSSVKFGWEVLKANTTDEAPDVGARKHFSFKVR